MSTKKPLVIDIDKRIVGTFVSYIDDDANASEVKIQIVPLGTAFAFTFTDNSETTPYSVSMDDVHTLPSIKDGNEQMQSYEGDLIVVMRSDGEFQDNELDKKKKEVREQKRKIDKLESQIKSLEQELSEATDPKEKESRNQNRRGRMRMGGTDWSRY